MYFISYFSLYFGFTSVCLKHPVAHFLFCGMSPFPLPIRSKYQSKSIFSLPLPVLIQMKQHSPLLYCLWFVLCCPISTNPLTFWVLLTDLCIIYSCFLWKQKVGACHLSLTCWEGCVTLVFLLRVDLLGGFLTWYVWWLVLSTAWLKDPTAIKYWE